MPSEIERIRKNHVAGDHGDHGCITCGDEDVWQPSWPCDAAKLLDQLAAVTAERDVLLEALKPYSAHRLSLLTTETANQIRFTVGLDGMNRSEAIEALECMRGYVARTVPPMLEALRKARAALAARAVTHCQSLCWN